MSNRTLILRTAYIQAIVKRIVDLHKGKVGVEDNPEGQGSVFWVKLKKA